MAIDLQAELKKAQEDRQNKAVRPNQREKDYVTKLTDIGFRYYQEQGIKPETPAEWDAEVVKRGGFSHGSEHLKQEEQAARAAADSKRETGRMIFNGGLIAGAAPLVVAALPYVIPAMPAIDWDTAALIGGGIAATTSGVAALGFANPAKSRDEDAELSKMQLKLLEVMQGGFEGLVKGDKEMVGRYRGAALHMLENESRSEEEKTKRFYDTLFVMSLNLAPDDEHYPSGQPVIGMA